MPADLDGYDDQDQSEVFDEDNTELEEQVYGGHDNGETFEELPDVLDVTQALGDEDDDEAEIGEEMDDEEIVARAMEEDDLEEDDVVSGEMLAQTADHELADLDDDMASAAGEVELEYVGDLNDLAGAASAAQALEAARLSDADLRELDYKDEFTIDEDEAAPAP